MFRPWKGAVLVTALCSVSMTAMAGSYKQGEVIVKYKPGVSRTRLVMSQIYNAIGATDIYRYRGLMEGMEQISIDPSRSVEQIVALLKTDPNVEYAQPNYLLHTMPVTSLAVEGVRNAQPHGEPCLIPGVPYPPGCGENSPVTSMEEIVTRPEVDPFPADVDPPVEDPLLGRAYGLTKIAAADAWQVHRGDRRFIVADIDTGIDYNHEDLAGNLFRNPGPASDGVVGYDFVHNDGLPFDDNEHGTHTAGTIGAVGGNGVGISGVIQRVSIMSLKFLSGEGSGTTSDAIRAIDYAVAHGAKVLSNSWGGSADEENVALGEAIERARAQDVLFIAAAGNDGTDNDGSDPAYPASFTYDNMITVAATDARDQLASFSNYGKKTTHLAAPGVNIYSTVPGGKYKKLSGTSMACPHVAGAAALVWSLHPKWNAQQVKERLLSSVDFLPALKDKTITGGRLNVLRAMK